MNSVTCTLCAAGVSLGLAGFATGAAAQDMSNDTASYGGNMHNPGFYIGGGLGWAMTDSDDDDLSWKGLAGWRFNEMLSAQAFYAGLGEHDVPGPLFGDADAETYGLEGLVSFPLTETVALYGKGGIHRYDLDVRGDDDGTSWLGGAGVEFAVAQNMSLRAEWTHYDMDQFDDVDDFGAQLVFGF